MKIQAKTLRTGLRGLLLGATVVGVMPMAVGCLDRPVAPASPRTSNTLTDQVVVSSVDKIDLVFMIDNSASMADKQKVLAAAVPDLVNRLVDPICVAPDPADKTKSITQPKVEGPNNTKICPPGFQSEFTPIKDIHIAVVTSSLGGHGSDFCVSGSPQPNNFTQDDRGRLINRGRRLAASAGKGSGAIKPEDYTTVETYQNSGFFAWDPDQKQTPPGENSVDDLNNNFRSMVEGADQVGCGFEASLEAWYRFLIDPNPLGSITTALTAGGNPTPLATPVVTGTDDVLLQQRAAFLRPDSLVAIVNLSDENDCSIIDGAMPPSVCNTPTLDADGKVTGCSGPRTPWPANYARGNFSNVVVTDGTVSGTPFPINNLASQLEIAPPTLAELNITNPTCSPKLVDGKAVPAKTFCLQSGTPACETDPDSPACQSCYLDGTGTGCKAQTIDDPKGDPTNLRCWDQKRRFGVDMLYPLQRYIDGLRNPTVYDRDGNLVPNPLYGDLPYDASQAAVRAGQQATLTRGRAQPRPAAQVFFATIVGVPWQDIARDPKDLSQGYKPSYPTPEETTSIDWDIILGNPLGYNGEKRVDPKDPLMIESNVSTAREGKQHPILTDQTISATGWNSINGHEWNSAPSDLQYACIFDLDPGTDGAYDECTEDFPDTTKNPLCEKPKSATDTTGSGQYDVDGAGKLAAKQYRAKAYPGTRFLQVARSFGGNSIVASICSPNLRDNTKNDFGYRPAVGAIIDRLKTQLAGRCLPRQLDTNNGVAPCLIIDAQFQKTAPDNDPVALADCQKCSGTARKKLDPTIESLLTGAVKDDYLCRCEVTQLAGADLQQCRTDTNAAPALTSGGGGWCYVDPTANQSDSDKAAAETIVSKCAATEKRTIRFINTNTQNTTLFITCLGAASGTNEIDTSGGGGAAGAAGAPGTAGAAGQ